MIKLQHNIDILVKSIHQKDLITLSKKMLFFDISGII